MDKKNIKMTAAEMEEPFGPDVPIKQYNLNHPTKEFVVEAALFFRSNIKKYCAEISDESIDDNLEALPETDLLLELLYFFNKYFVFMMKCEGVDSMISLVDFCGPTARRTKIRFKLLFNFLEFYSNQVDYLKEFVMARKMQANEMTFLKEKQDAIRTKLSAKAEKISRDEDKLVQLKKSLQEVELRYSNTQDIKDKNTEKCKILQQDLKVALDTCKNKQILLQNVQSSITNLNEQVIIEESYNSLNDLKKNLIKTRDDLEEDTVNIAEGLKQKVVDIEIYKAVRDQVGTLITAGENLRTHMDALNKMKSDQADIESKYNSHAAQTEQKKDSLFKLKTNNKLRSADFQFATVENDKIIRNIYEAIEQISLEEKEENELHKKLHENQALRKRENQKLQNKLQAEEDNVKALINKYNNAYRKFIESENDLTTTFNRALENLLNLLSEDS